MNTLKFSLVLMLTTVAVLSSCSSESNLQLFLSQTSNCKHIMMFLCGHNVSDKYKDTAVHCNGAIYLMIFSFCVFPSLKMFPV